MTNLTVDEMIKFTHNNNEADKLQLKLAMHCAPLFSGIKASSCLVLSIKECIMLQSMINDNNLSFWYLCQWKEYNMILLYQKDKLEELIGQQQVRKYLISNGYTDLDLTKVLIQLSNRLNEYHKKQVKYPIMEFPHEIGIILDYPIKDVKAFITNAGKNELMSGYWKVYYDVEKAKRIFQLYDNAKEEAVRRVLSGIPIGYVNNNL